MSRTVDLGKYVMCGTPVLNSDKQYFICVDLSNEKRDRSVTCRLSIEGLVAEQKRRFLKTKRGLLYALTHGYEVTVCGVKTNAPGELRMACRAVPFVSRYTIEKDSVFYKVKNGRLRPIQVWPVSQRTIDEYEKKLNRFVC